MSIMSVLAIFAAVAARFDPIITARLSVPVVTMYDQGCERRPCSEADHY
jgi:hypothetical protein